MAANLKMEMPKIPKLKMPAFSFKGIKMPEAPLSFLKKSTAAVEIGPNWLKIAAAVEGKTGRRLTAAAWEPVQGLDELSIALKINQFLKINKLSPSKALISFPSQNLTTRILSLPSTDPAEIQDIVELQAVKQTPYSREEITSGFHLIGSDETGYSKIFLAISHRDQASHYFRVPEMAFLLPDQIVPSVEGLRFWFQKLRGKELDVNAETVLVLEADESSSDLIVMAGRKILLARSIGLGGKQLREQGPAMESEFLREVQRTLESGSEEMRSITPVRVILTGLADTSKTIAALLSRELNVPCEIVPALEPFQTSAEPRVLELLSKSPVSFASLSGLLLSGETSSINLMPPDVRMRKNLENRAKELAFLGTLLLTLVMLGSLVGFEKIYKRSTYLEYLQKQYSEIKGPAEDVEKILGKMKLAQEQTQAPGDFLEVLNDVNLTLPDTMNILSMEYSSKDRNVVLRGTAQEMSSVFSFLSTLEAAPSLEQVKTRSVTKRKEGDKEISEFEITANLTGLKASKK